MKLQVLVKGCYELFLLEAGDVNWKEHVLYLRVHQPHVEQDL